MTADIATANTSERVGSDWADIVITDISKGGVSSEHLDTTAAEKTSCDFEA
jgi:hypothetical protein